MKDFRKAPRKHENRLVILFLCLLGFLILTFPAGCKKEAPGMAFPPATVLAAKAVQKDMPVIIAAIGTVGA